jgi:hypothetical protein
MTLGLDYSGGRLTGAQIRAAGYGFVVRYLENGLGSGRVNLTPSEFANLRADGVHVALVWESQANRAAVGGAAGRQDAQAAAAAAHAVGADGWPIYFAVDFDVPDYAPNTSNALSKLGPVGAYFVGVRDVLPPERVGVYGGYYAVSRALDAGLASLAWQTVAWSGGQLDPRVHLVQRAGYVTVAGVQCDVNEQRKDYFGQAAALAAAVTTTTGVDEMTSYIVKLSSADSAGNYALCATQDGPVIHGCSWSNAKATIAKQNGGGLTGLTDSEWADREATSNAVKAAAKALAGGLPAGGGAAGASKQDVADVVDAALGSLHANTTTSFSVGN